MKSARNHAFTLGVIILLGLGLRLWGLDTKPLWLDEVLTALFSLGLSYDNLPKQQNVSLNDLYQLFSYQTATSCPQIAQNLAQQSNHPPLFFCAQHLWVGWLQHFPLSLAWQLRSLPALFGSIAIGLTYLLNRVAFGPTAGLLGAGLMAVSPFGIDLSQEARHYSLPICVALLALTLLVVLTQHLRQTGKLPWPALLAWVVINGVGFYTHYFFLYVLAAQLFALGWWWLLERPPTTRQAVWGVGLAITVVAGVYLPGVLRLLSYVDNAETQWLVLQTDSWFAWLAPLIRLVVLFLTMITMLPVETRPIWQVVALALILLPALILTLGWAARGIRQLWRNPKVAVGGKLLMGFMLGAVGVLVFSIYLLRRDLSLGSRYSFIYFPSVIALLSAGLVAFQPPLKTWQRSLVLGLGVCGTIFVISNQALLKPYELDRSIHRVLTTPVAVALSPVQPQTQPLLVVVAYHAAMPRIVGLSFALEMFRQLPQSKYHRQLVDFAFLDAQQSSPNLPSQFAQLQPRFHTPFALWLVGEEPFGKLHLGQPEVSAILAKRGCQPNQQSVFRGSYGTVFRPYQCPAL